jgi:hypothetical protein
MKTWLFASTIVMGLAGSADAAVITLGIQQFGPGDVVTESEFNTVSAGDIDNFFQMYAGLSFGFAVPMMYASEVQLTLGVVGDVKEIVAGNPLPGDTVDVTNLFDLSGDPAIYRLLTATIQASVFPVYEAGFHGGMSFYGIGGLDFLRLEGPWAHDVTIPPVPEPPLLLMALGACLTFAGKMHYRTWRSSRK